MEDAIKRLYFGIKFVEICIYKGSSTSSQEISIIKKLHSSNSFCTNLNLCFTLQELFEVLWIVHGSDGIGKIQQGEGRVCPGGRVPQP